MRDGEEVIVTDRGRPVARLSTIDASIIAVEARAALRKGRPAPTQHREAKSGLRELLGFRVANLLDT